MCCFYREQNVESIRAQPSSCFLAGQFTKKGAQPKAHNELGFGEQKIEVTTNKTASSASVLIPLPPAPPGDPSRSCFRLRTRSSSAACRRHFYRPTSGSRSDLRYIRGSTSTGHPLSRVVEKTWRKITASVHDDANILR